MLYLQKLLIFQLVYILLYILNNFERTYFLKMQHFHVIHIFWKIEAKLRYFKICITVRLYIFDADQFWSNGIFPEKRTVKELLYIFRKTKLTKLKNYRFFNLLIRLSNGLSLRQAVLQALSNYDQINNFIWSWFLVKSSIQIYSLKAV